MRGAGEAGRICPWNLPPPITHSPKHVPQIRDAPSPASCGAFERVRTFPSPPQTQTVAQLARILFHRLCPCCRVPCTHCLHLCQGRGQLKSGPPIGDGMGVRDGAS